MRTKLRVVAGAVFAAVLVSTLLSAPAGAVSGAVQPIAGCDAQSLAANDDNSSPQVSLPFELNFYGSSYSSIYVNNNGNVTFTSDWSEFTPSGLGAVDFPIIAPFFADVDTRGSGSDIVRYGESTDGSMFCVNWVDVGYYSAHADKLNSFQLLLVDRSLAPGGTPGDFDIVFNYDQVQWETGDLSGGTGGLGGTSAAVGFSDGTGNFFELPGSLIPGSFLDQTGTGDPNPTALTRNSLNSLDQDGRYVFPIRAGDVPSGGVTGLVLGSGAPLSGAFVQVCEAGGGLCRTATTNELGRYTVTGLNTGDFTVGAWGPSGTTFLPGALPSAVHVDEAATPPVTSAPDLNLTGPTPIPEGTTIEPSGINNGIPTVYWRDALDLATDGCERGTATYAVTLGGVVISSGSMAEGPLGHYTAVIDAFYPENGDAHVAITITCPAAPEQHVDFDIYIDPSGVVKDQNDDPIAGAAVTLYRSDSSSGPFAAVADGSGIMSPANRTNPDTTDAAGHFGWDVVAGFYVVRAEATGCHAPGSATAYVETAVLTIPPPVTDLVLTLECATNQAPIADAGTEQTVASGANVNLDGTGSSDPDGTIASHSWTQTGGPSVTLSGANTATPSFTAPTGPATLTFGLTVTDNDGATDTDSVVVTVQAPPPVVDAAGEVIVKDGTRSSASSKAFFVQVRNVGVAPLTLSPSDMDTQVLVNGSPLGTVSALSSSSKTLSSGAKTKFRFEWNYTGLTAGASVEYDACVNVAGDVNSGNDCDSATVTAK